MRIAEYEEAECGFLTGNEVVSDNGYLRVLLEAEHGNSKARESDTKQGVHPAITLR